MKELNSKDFNVIETNDKIEGLKRNIVNYTKCINEQNKCEDLEKLINKQ